MLKWTRLITKLEHSHPEFQMPKVKAKYFKKICNTTIVQFQHFLSLSLSLVISLLSSFSLQTRDDEEAQDGVDANEDMGLWDP